MVRAMRVRGVVFVLLTMLGFVPVACARGGTAERAEKGNVGEALADDASNGAAKAENSDEPSATTNGPTQESPAQLAAFADGQITFIEYRKAVLNMRECIVAGGGEIQGPTLAADDTYAYSWADSVEESGLGPRCYYREFGRTDIAWQTGPHVQRKREPENAKELRDLQECLGELTSTTVTETNRGVLKREIAKRGANPAACLLRD